MILCDLILNEFGYKHETNELISGKSLLAIYGPYRRYAGKSRAGCHQQLTAVSGILYGRKPRSEGATSKSDWKEADYFE